MLARVPAGFVQELLAGPVKGLEIAQLLPAAVRPCSPFAGKQTQA